ncbi:sarcoplasmic reticulum histidine-rich calcium-binding protein-like isoform X2 [Teleopsis dalmanni]|uniref:sarcoplasmic reticulum histidine-rich calcium-binding protein-like isoform X1 n=1 Tax=Teleopsis dalmanni TaxID=139649 RepID=UPI0018CDC6D3|nr:sarcoplasmic reticulum histidine-rich calcium-binding protein-like isoform X1 [Teleopsis dalmanni]XP_037939632.1 sarcoplasmic reticulum histidine-rich calcium-binding protein-like isoform X2 [Teleopsis dalmanni]
MATVKDYVIAMQELIRDQAKNISTCVIDSDGFPAKCARYVRDAFMNNMRELGYFQCENNIPGKTPEDMYEEDKNESRKLKQDIKKLRKKQQQVKRKIDMQQRGKNCSAPTDKEVEKELKKLKKTSEKIEKRLKKKMEKYKTPTKHSRHEKTGPDEPEQDSMWTKFLNYFCRKSNKEDRDGEYIKNEHKSHGVKKNKKDQDEYEYDSEEIEEDGICSGYNTKQRQRRCGEDTQNGRRSGYNTMKRHLDSDTDTENEDEIGKHSTKIKKQNQTRRKEYKHNKHGAQKNKKEEDEDEYDYEEIEGNSRRSGYNTMSRHLDSDTDTENADRIGKHSTKISKQNQTRRKEHKHNKHRAQKNKKEEDEDEYDYEEIEVNSRRSGYNTMGRHLDSDTDTENADRIGKHSTKISKQNQTRRKEHKHNKHGAQKNKKDKDTENEDQIGKHSTKISNQNQTRRNAYKHKETDEIDEEEYNFFKKKLD